MMVASELIACARRFSGVRFMHQGRSVHGLDCLGLLIITAQECALRFGGQSADALDVPQYGARPDVQMLKQKLDAHLVPIETHAAREGDVVLLKIDGSPQHLALLTDYPIAGELGMIHAYASARKVVEHRYDKDWKRATYAAYRLPQLI